MSARYHQRLATCLPLKRATLAEEAVSEGREPRSPGGGLNKPTGPVKPARSGNGLPDRFDRKSVEIGQIQNQIQNPMFNRFLPVYRPV